jgi:hypothetical protein
VTASASGMDILHRYTRAVRYHAEDATTIREAVVAACGRGADLGGALGIEAWRVSPLMMLLDQTGPIRAYKLVDAEGQSPMQSTEKLTYTVGRAYEVADANTNPTVDCGAGINVATMDWCLREYNAGWRVMVVEFTAADIACVPIASDGKFRLHRCTVVGEKDITALVSKPEVVS